MQPEKPAEPEKPSEENPPTGDTGNNGDTGDAEEPSDENVTEPPAEPVIPKEPASGDPLTGNLNVGDIDTALSGNSVVKISQTGTVNMVKQTLTIPTGKTLIIDTVFSGSESTGYKGFYMDKESKIIVEPNATLYINGNIMGGIIELNSSTIYNKGTIDGEAMTASGVSKIINYNIIKLQQAFTGNSTDTMVDYQGSSESVFISNEESTAMPTEAGSSGTLLAQAVSGNSGTSDEISIVQYIYADYLNAHAASYMNLLSEKQNSTITWYFTKDAVLPAGKEVTL